MKYIETVLIYLLTFAEYFSVYFVLLRKKTELKGGWRRILYCIVFAVSGCGILCCWNIGVWLMPAFLCSFLLLYLLFDIRLAENIMWWALTFVALSIVETLLNHFLMTITSMGETTRIIVYLLCIVSGIWLFYIFVGKKWKKETLTLPFPIWCILIGIMTLVIGMITYFAYVTSFLTDDTMQKTGVIFLSAGGIAICIMLLYLIYFFNGKQKLEFQNQMQEHYNDQQREYFLSLLKKEEDTRRFRHDLIGDLLTMKSFSDQREYDRMDAYLIEMLGELQYIGKRQYDVGNEIVNVILNHYFHPLKENCHITIQGYIQEETGISQRDLCVLVSNLVKNAVEGLQQCQSLTWEIVFSIEQGEQYIRIYIANSFEQGSAVGKNGIFESKKEDRRNHGWGMKNVTDIVEKYGGRYTYKVENQRYVAEIYLKQDHMY